MKQFVEQDCTIEHEGRTFESGGAYIVDGRIAAYPAKAPHNGRQPLCDWHGNEIGYWYVINSRPAVFFGYQSFMGDRYYYMRGVVDGVRYSLRGFGPGMIATGKRLANQ